MTLFVVITSIISYIQAYVQILIMTEGGPGTSTYLASYIIYDEAFVKYNFGYASALSFVLFVITAVLTVGGKYHEKKSKQYSFKCIPSIIGHCYSLSVYMDAMLII